MLFRHFYVSFLKRLEYYVDVLHFFTGKREMKKLLLSSIAYRVNASVVCK
jgi:hypothetical protein